MEVTAKPNYHHSEEQMQLYFLREVNWDGEEYGGR
jgi:hypothetical protein